MYCMAALTKVAHVWLDRRLLAKYVDTCRLQGRSLSSFLRLVLGCCNWASTTEDHIVLPVPKALTHDPELLRAALLQAVDRIVERYEIGT